MEQKKEAKNQCTKCIVASTNYFSSIIDNENLFANIGVMTAEQNDKPRSVREATSQKGQWIPIDVFLSYVEARRCYNTFCAKVHQTDTQICKHYKGKENTNSGIELPSMLRYAMPIHEFMKHIYGPSYYKKTPEELREVITRGYGTKKRG